MALHGYHETPGQPVACRTPASMVSASPDSLDLILKTTPPSGGRGVSGLMGPAVGSSLDIEGFPFIAARVHHSLAYSIVRLTGHFGSVIFDKFVILATARRLSAAARDMHLNERRLITDTGSSLRSRPAIMNA